VEKYGGKRPVGRSGFRWEVNIKRMSGLHWIDLAQDKDKWRILVKALMNLHFP
jgi:hypothetical protein